VRVVFLTAQRDPAVAAQALASTAQLVRFAVESRLLPGC
jgi:hypothetical protein